MAKGENHSLDPRRRFNRYEYNSLFGREHYRLGEVLFDGGKKMLFVEGVFRRLEAAVFPSKASLMYCLETGIAHYRGTGGEFNDNSAKHMTEMLDFAKDNLKDDDYDTYPTDSIVSDKYGFSYYFLDNKRFECSYQAFIKKGIIYWCTCIDKSIDDTALMYPMFFFGYSKHNYEPQTFEEFMQKENRK